MDTGPPSRGGADHLPPPSAEVRSGWNYASILPASLHGVDPQNVKNNSIVCSVVKCLVLKGIENEYSYLLEYDVIYSIRS
jgi:hypothetical protein